MSFVWGWLVGPARAQADADDRARARGPSGWSLGGVSRSASGRSGLALFLVAGAILGSAGWAASRWPTACSWSGSRRRSGSASSSGSTAWSARARRSSASCSYGADHLPAARHARHRRLPDRGPEPARHDAHRALAGLAGQRPLGRLRRAHGRPRGPARRPSACARPAPRSSPRLSGSVAVAARVALPPRPGRADHLVEGRAARRQPSTSARPVDRRDEHRRVAGAARPDGVRDRAPDDRSAAASTSRTRTRRRCPRLQTSGSSVRGSPGAVASSAAQVGVGEVRDVDVVADAGAVRRRVVVAEQRQRRAAPSAAARTFGMRCVSGSWSSPSASVAPATLK